MSNPLVNFLPAALRTGLDRMRVEHRLLDAVSRLAESPETRCAYQALLDEHMRLSQDPAGEARGPAAAWPDPSKR